MLFITMFGVFEIQNSRMQCKVYFLGSVLRNFIQKYFRNFYQYKFLNTVQTKIIASFVKIPEFIDT